VLATIGNSEDEKSCRDVGVNHVVNHHNDDWAEQILDFTKGNKVSRVVDVEFGANLPQVLGVISTGGTIATYSSMLAPEPKLPFMRMMFMDLTVRAVLVCAMPESAKEMAVHDVIQVLEKEKFHHRIKYSMPLDEIATSRQLIEQGGVSGCVVLEIREGL